MSDLTHSDISQQPARQEQTWLPGLPHVVVACATWPVFGGSACVTGLLLAALASFVVYLPLTALTLNHGKAIAEDAAAPALTPTAQAVLLGLWSATAWLGAALAAAAH
jgi:hypothetical protein